eukprot:6341586-Amphidinium_carterae.1
MQSEWSSLENCESHIKRSKTNCPDCAVAIGAIAGVVGRQANIVVRWRLGCRGPRAGLCEPRSGTHNSKPEGRNIREASGAELANQQQVVLRRIKFSSLISNMSWKVQSLSFLLMFGSSGFCILEE